MRYEKSQVHCYSCQRFRHYALECRVSSTRVHEKVNYIEENNEEDGTLLLVRNDTSGDYENTWYLDISTSNHKSQNKNMFIELNESIKADVAFGEDSKVQIKGKCNILFFF